jgi:hypothetical protein
VEKAQVVLEEVMAHAIAAARCARAAAADGSDQQGEALAFAYYDMVDVIREQAELLGIEWADRTLADFVPESLLGLRDAPGE